MIRHHHRALALALLLTAPATAAAQDAMTVLNAAVKAMRLENVTTIRYTATGSAYAIGQSFTPGGPYPRSAMTFVRDFDIDGFTVRQEFVNTRVERRGGGLPNRVGAETRQVQYASRNSGWPQHVFMWLNPPGFVKEAMKHNPTLTTERVGGRAFRVITVRVQDRYTLRGFFNDEDLLERVDTALDNNPVLGDPPLDAVFTGYRDFGGILFPSRIVHHLGLQPSFDFEIASVTPNAAVETTPPAGAGGAAGGGAVTVTSQTIANGVHYLTGGTHHSVAVEFSDHVAVIDAPLGEARSLAVIAEVRRLAPNKPIRHLINTHHHFDHSNGLRTYAAEGATVVTHPRNAAFYQQWWSTMPVLLRDRLVESGRTARFETVDERRVLSDGMRTLEVHVVQDTTHVEGMLILYLPSEKLLVEADLFTPPAPGAAPAQNAPGNDPLAAELVQNIERLDLDVERVVPLHGPGVASRADLDRAAGTTAAGR
ncbi:MAG: MBL fold metallo-hydrolase [Acidobacteria bacterium]|nr:MBL fold metallo-hydrolase [Acidobacteriota bacterium]